MTAATAAKGAGFIGNLLSEATAAPLPLFRPERSARRIIPSHPLDGRTQRCIAKECAHEARGGKEDEFESWKGAAMNSDPDPFEQGERAARQNIPAEANPYQDGSEEHALWAAGHEKIASAREANESEGT
jgi:hypothetical protein